MESTIISWHGLFYCPVILLLIWKTIWWRNIVFGIMDQCDTKIDLVKYMRVSDLYFMVSWFCLMCCHTFQLWIGTGRRYSCPSWHLLLLTLSHFFHSCTPLVVILEVEGIPYQYTGKSQKEKQKHTRCSELHISMTSNWSIKHSDRQFTSMHLKLSQASICRNVAAVIWFGHFVN